MRGYRHHTKGRKQSINTGREWNTGSMRSISNMAKYQLSYDIYYLEY